MDVEALTQDEAEAAMHELVRLHMYEEEGWQGWGRGDGRDRGGGAEHEKNLHNCVHTHPQEERLYTSMIAEELEVIEVSFVQREGGTLRFVTVVQREGTLWPLVWHCWLPSSIFHIQARTLPLLILRCCMLRWSKNDTCRL